MGKLQSFPFLWKILKSGARISLPWLWICIEQNLTSVILVCFGKSRDRNMMQFFCKVTKCFILSDQEQLKYNRSPFKKSSSQCLILFLGIHILLNGRTIRVIQSSGVVSEICIGKWDDRAFGLVFSVLPLPFSKSQSVYSV